MQCLSIIFTSTPTPPTTHIHQKPRPTNIMSFFFKFNNPSSPTCAVYIPTDIELSTALLQKPSQECSARNGNLWAPLLSVLKYWLERPCTGFVQATTAAESSWMQWSCHDQKTFLLDPPCSLALTIFLSPLWWWSLSLDLGRGKTVT